LCPTTLFSQSQVECKPRRNELPRIIASSGISGK
jgi:hypothetical protein